MIVTYRRLAAGLFEICTVMAKPSAFVRRNAD